MYDSLYISGEVKRKKEIYTKLHYSKMIIMPTNHTIAVSLETRDRMNAAKIHGRETFDDLINRLLDLLPKLSKQKVSQNKLLSTPQPRHSHATLRRDGIER